MTKYTPVFTVECAPIWVPFEVVMNEHGDLTEQFGHCIECDSIEQAQQIIAEVISVEGQAKHLGSNLFLELVDWEIIKIRED
ncbi:hypothetical protein [Corynebacterium pseudodiphtheriticum]|uniref:hypothetical protein n=1 Tax=Corynebacterium pseudodiphtheriticum TaxID=37637 RepID=UPI002540AD3E|nr:hypothetical protein [Corynebacterium pseudodiphtheriticum]MDK4286951.1 hypothetical protein [Corynebacterium pseudodiphtheriticum]